MEELSIEQKAEAYDNLIERLKNFQFEYRFSAFSDTIERYFPELKSEDERIKESLINYFEDFHLQTFAGLDPKKILAWLKAQNHWKPSKELLEAFDYYMDAIISDRDRAMFLELYNYLKQL